MSLEPSAGSPAPRAKKEMPVWGGVVVGIVVASAVVGIVLRSRAKHTVEPRAQAAISTTSGTSGTPGASGTPSTEAATDEPTAPSSPAERVVVYPVVHPASSSSVGKTEERVAIDALLSGDPHRAAALYGELAKTNPDNAAIVDAARLLGGGTPAR